MFKKSVAFLAILIMISLNCTMAEQFSVVLSEKAAEYYEKAIKSRDAKYYLLVIKELLNKDSKDITVGDLYLVSELYVQAGDCSKNLMDFSSAVKFYSTCYTIRKKLHLNTYDIAPVYVLINISIYSVLTENQKLYDSSIKELETILPKMTAVNVSQQQLNIYLAEGYSTLADYYADKNKKKSEKYEKMSDKLRN